LWLNLPAKDKMVMPKYHGITQADIPVIDEGSSKIHNNHLIFIEI
jgi:redox-sensitive bicupin YhaK (pirin superfamily)